MDVTVVAPIYNERDSILPLYRQMVDAMEETGRSFQILFVDDGSRDGTARQLDLLAERDQRVKVIRFRRNYGQTAALQAGMTR